MKIRGYFRSNPKISLKRYILFIVLLLVIVLHVTGYELRLLRTQMLVKNIKLAGINYDAFRNLCVSKDALNRVNKKLTRLLKRYPELQGQPYIDQYGYVTFSMLAADYNLSGSNIPDEQTFIRGMAEVAKTPCFRELYGYYKAILSDLKYFPIPKVIEGNADISFDNSWYVKRSYGGNRRHEGTDLVADNNISGYFPIVSISDGVVEKMGWLDKGGYRIGIRALTGGYFYYAHLHSYAPGLKTGDRVIAGQFLGFMGDTGYGPEGTAGKFDVHLHFGIYIKSNIGDMSVNPYWLLKMLEDSRTVFTR